VIGSWLSSLGHFLYEFTLTYGVIGLGTGAFVESLGVPTASIVIELAAGTLILTGRTTFLEALIVSDLGLTLGSLASYYVGRAGARAVDAFRPKSLEQAEHSKARAFLMRHGERGILFAQLFGPARTWISLPAGAMKLEIKRFTIYTAIGGAIYCSIAIGISFLVTGLLKKRVEQIFGYLNVQGLVGLGLGLLALYLVWRYLRKRNNNRKDPVVTDSSEV